MTVSDANVVLAVGGVAPAPHAVSGGHWKEKPRTAQEAARSPAAPPSEAAAPLDIPTALPAHRQQRGLPELSNPRSTDTLDGTRRKQT